MTHELALAYVTFAASQLGVPLTEEELRHAAGRALAKQAELSPLYAALPAAPIEGMPAFRPDDETAQGEVSSQFHA